MYINYNKNMLNTSISDENTDEIIESLLNQDMIYDIKKN